MTTVDGLPEDGADSTSLPICANGHPNAIGAAFCSTCGSPLASVAKAQDPAAVPTPTPASRANRPLVLAAFALFAVVAIVVVGAMALGPKGQTIRGVISLWGFDNSTGSWSDCSGDGGYDDLSAGGNVRIKNGSGDTIGAATLKNITEADLATIVEMDRAPGLLVGLESTDSAAAVTELRKFLNDSSVLACFLWWEAKGVPASPLYGIEITHRGTLDYSQEQMAANGWIVSSSIGDN